ncbi:MAG: AAA family ATPase [Ktedonobacterales bacterium]
MRITSVALENIKSYQKIEVPFSSGTTAIRGHNGAGKSTLVEAVGFALFDALNYSQDQFVREGERYGVVTVSFISAEDDREYQAVRRCGSSPIWYVYDPELQMRVVEQKTDVNDFLRRHLRIETDISLRDLFNDALGIPQGTFTADFLLAPASRKKKFDTLLQIEDYRKVAEKLNETRVYLQEQRRDIEKRIADFERETNQLESWRISLAALRDQQQDIASRLQDLQRKSAEVEKRRDALQAQREKIHELDNTAKLADATCLAAESRRDHIIRLLEEAREAARNCHAAIDDYQRYLAVQDQSKAASQRAELRDELQRQRNEIDQEHTGVARDLLNARQQFDAARQAEERIVELLPTVNRQQALEQDRDTAQRQTERSAEVSRRLEQARQNSQHYKRDVQACEKAIAALELLRPQAALLDQRREHLAMLQDQRARQSERKKRLNRISLEQREAVASREKAAGNEARVEENLRKIRANQSVAEELPLLEDECNAIEDQVRRIETRRDQHERSSQASVGGNCPFLHEPCLNIQRKGVRSLGSYFDRLIAEEDDALVTTRNQLAQAEGKRNRAREVRKYYDRLDVYEQQLSSTTEQRVAAEKRLVELAAEQQEIEYLDRTSPGESDLAEAQKLFKESDDADKQLRELEPRRAELARLTSQQTELAQEAEGLERELAILAPAQAMLAQTKKDLAALGDPRAECSSLQRIASARTAQQEVVSALHARVHDLESRLTRLKQELMPFAALDSEIAKLRQELERRQPGYHQYLRYEKLAEQLPARENEVRAAITVAEAAREHAVRALTEYKDAGETFDEEALKQAEHLSKELKDEDAGKRAELYYLLKQSQELEANIARVEALQPQLAAERKEYATVEDLEGMLAHFRDIIRESGPHIMKALLREISIQANRIFGEIMGDRSAELAWTNEYEIVLCRNGQERTFAQLSGGEQMSAALAVRLALLRHLSRLDIAFFDEPTQNMDGERRGNLAEQIRRVRGFDQLIVISHDDTFEQGLDSVIHLEKRDGMTVLLDDNMLTPA